MSKKKNCNYVAVGGQALMEGIMMRGPEGTAMSLRLPDGSIETTMKDFVSVRKKYKIFAIPFIRGIVAFIESLVFGYKCLMESAEKTTPDFESEEGDSKLDKWLTEHFGPKMMTVIGIIGSVLGMALVLVLFFWMPSAAFDAINDHLAHGAITSLRTVFEGLIRIIIFIIYMVLVSRMSEIHRVFMYHGAEHKSIFCFENGLELTVENVRKQGRYHPRCGTSFIFVMIILSILISSLVAALFPVLTETRLVWMAVKLGLMPIIMGLGFEFIQFAGKHPNKVTKALSAPGLLMQRITTAEPTDDIIEVGIESLKAALSGKGSVVAAPEDEQNAPAEETAENENGNGNGNEE